ncbi:MAG: hypothetical protein COB53_12000 [Elusimicrobia bacterium]|nr:MAG: hypothetical protein COB53_12000 [Elusimicrobiota bacterium]
MKFTLKAGAGLGLIFLGSLAFLPSVGSETMPDSRQKLAAVKNSLQAYLKATFLSKSEFEKEWVQTHQRLLNEGRYNHQRGGLTLRVRRLTHQIVDESNYRKIETDIIVPWENAWKTSDSDAFQKLTTDKAELEPFGAALPAAWRKIEGINEYQWREGNSLITKSHHASDLQKYLDNFKTIQTFDLDVFENKILMADRAEDYSFDKSRLAIRFDLRGYTEQGERRHDRGMLYASVKQVAGIWKISKLTLAYGDSLIATRKPSFVSKTKGSGIDRATVYTREEAIRRGGFAMAISDYNGDAIPDIYLGAYGEGSLWKGRKDGTYVEDKAAGIKPHTRVKSAVFSDFDNDGDKDLILVRFTRKKELGDIIFYKNEEGRFTQAKDFIDQRFPSDYAMPATVGDFDKDGLLDLYVGFPGLTDFTALGRRDPADEKMVPQGLYFFTEKGTFKNRTARLATRGNVFPHAAMAVDYDTDGDMDIIVVDDKNNLSPLYKNNGTGHFQQVADTIGLGSWGYGMGVAAADLFNVGRLEFLMTNVAFTAHNRMTNSLKTNFDKLSLRREGFRVFKNNGEGMFNEITGQRGLTYPGEGAAGVEFLDYNNDGWLDIYVSNGLWSGTDKHNDISSLYSQSLFALQQRLDLIGSRTFSTSFLNILRSFKGDVYNTDKKGDSRPSMAGFQRNRLYRNMGDGTFVEVAFLEGIDSISDGYMVAKADLNQDGKMDLVLRNCDPGTEANRYPALEIFENVHPNANSLSVSLQGFVSNRDAIGANVFVTVDGSTQLQQMLANTGAVQSQYRLIFGLGNNKVAEKVEIHWPAGHKTTLRNVPAGAHHYIEPKLKASLR